LTEESFPFFWRWSEWYQKKIREGGTPWLCNSVSEEVMLRDPSDKDRIFWWDKVTLNLLGMKRYEPSKAWAVMLNFEDG
jgi:hypothetical protein